MQLVEIVSFETDVVLFVVVPI